VNDVAPFRHCEPPGPREARPDDRLKRSNPALSSQPQDRFVGFASSEETFPVIASAAKQSRAQKKELDRFVGFGS
jgi:hypothetical protein